MQRLVRIHCTPSGAFGHALLKARRPATPRARQRCDDYAPCTPRYASSQRGATSQQVRRNSHTAATLDAPSEQGTRTDESAAQTDLADQEAAVHDEDKVTTAEGAPHLPLSRIAKRGKRRSSIPDQPSVKPAQQPADKSAQIRELLQRSMLRAESSSSGTSGATKHPLPLPRARAGVAAQKHAKALSAEAGTQKRSQMRIVRHETTSPGEISWRTAFQTLCEITPAPPLASDGAGQLAESASAQTVDKLPGSAPAASRGQGESSAEVGKTSEVSTEASGQPLFEHMRGWALGPLSPSETLPLIAGALAEPTAIRAASPDILDMAISYSLRCKDVAFPLLIASHARRMHLPLAHSTMDLLLEAAARSPEASDFSTVLSLLQDQGRPATPHTWLLFSYLTRRHMPNHQAEVTDKMHATKMLTKGTVLRQRAESMVRREMLDHLRSGGELEDHLEALRQRYGNMEIWLPGRVYDWMMRLLSWSGRAKEAQEVRQKLGELPAPLPRSRRRAEGLPSIQYHWKETKPRFVKT